MAVNSNQAPASDGKQGGLFCTVSKPFRHTTLGHGGGGALIVIAGLGVLSFIISQLHKVVSLLDQSPPEKTEDAPLGDTQRALAIPEHMPDDINQVAVFYRTLTDQMDSPFDVQQLYALGVENNFPHPHSVPQGPAPGRTNDTRRRGAIHLEALTPNPSTHEKQGYPLHGTATAIFDQHRLLPG